MMADEIDSPQSIKIRHSIEALDTFAHNLSKQGKLKEAIGNAQDIITCYSYSATGYLRLGEIYGVQGKQQQAIDVYKTGLSCISSDELDYTLLMDAKKNAIERIKRRIDFITILPFELCQSIFSDLPKESKAICLNVSSVWRNTLLTFEATWAVMTTYSSDICFAVVLPLIAGHVEDLTMDTRDSQIWSQYMKYMEDGYFTKLKKLKWADGVPYIPSALVYSRLKNTLTELNLGSMHIPIGLGLAEILYTCTKLTRLKFCAVGLLSDVIGDPTILEGVQLPLQDLQLDCYVTGESVGPLLQQCYQLQRLILNRASTSSTYKVVQDTCQNLQIFGLNPHCEITALQDSINSDERSGLRELYVNDDEREICPDDFYSMIRNNIFTLRVIKTRTLLIDIQDERRLPDIPTNQSYGDFRLPDLEQQSNNSNPNSTIESILLKFISTMCVPLRAFSAMNVTDMSPFIYALLAIPPVQKLSLHFDYDCRPSLELVRLFQYYATHSRTHGIRIRSCKTTKDDVLYALAGIKSLKKIDLQDICDMEGDEFWNRDLDLDRFLRGISDSVTSLTLNGVDSVADQHLAVIGTMQHLKTLRLENLPFITRDGVVKMITSFDMLDALIMYEFDENEICAVAKKHVKLFNGH